MTKAASSVFYFSLYAIISGFVIFIIPDIPLQILQIEVAETVWIRIIGFMLFEIGCIHFWAARTNQAAFFAYSIWGRMIPVACLILLVLFAGAPFQVLLFAIVDGVSAFHTWLVLRSEEASS